MDTIKIGFSRPKKWKPFATLIMKGYGIPYSHVYIKIWSEKYQRNLIYQASHTMVNFMGTELFDRENEIVREFPVEISAQSRTDLMQFAIDNAGIPYGVKNAFGLAVQRLAQLCGFKIKNPFSDGSKSFVCCEIAGYVLESFANVDLPQDLNEITLEQIYDFMVSVSKSD
jgi:hypothetical protein